MSLNNNNFVTKSNRTYQLTNQICVYCQGEAISWHLLEVLQPQVPYKRAVFHEITKGAILSSFDNPRDIDMKLVQSQETRRIVDRLTGVTRNDMA